MGQPGANQSLRAKGRPRTWSSSFRRRARSSSGSRKPTRRPTRRRGRCRACASTTCRPPQSSRVTERQASSGVQESPARRSSITLAHTHASCRSGRSCLHGPVPHRVVSVPVPARPGVPSGTDDLSSGKCFGVISKSCCCGLFVPTTVTPEISILIRVPIRSRHPSTRTPPSRPET